MINYKKNFIFIHIPKNAGTSMEAVLADEDCSLKGGQWSKKGFSSPLNHLTLSQVIGHEDIPPSNIGNFFKFCFIRNPWDKIISECFCPHIQAIFKECETIKDKIIMACEWGRKGGYGGHCKKQIDFVKHQNINMDFIGRFENLERDFSNVCEVLGVGPCTLPHKYKTARGDYKTFFDHETHDLVSDTYREDIEAFNYIY